LLSQNGDGVTRNPGPQLVAQLVAERLNREGVNPADIPEGDLPRYAVDPRQAPGGVVPANIFDHVHAAVVRQQLKIEHASRHPQIISLNASYSGHVRPAFVSLSSMLRTVS
jgi:hypothetical protein